MTKLQIDVDGYADSDDEERAELGRRLQDELDRLGVDTISRESTPSPPGAKGSALDWAQLIVTFAGSLHPMMALFESWLGRHPGASVTLEIEGDRLTLGGGSAEEARPLLEAWLERHDGA